MTTLQKRMNEEAIRSHSSGQFPQSSSVGIVIPTYNASKALIETLEEIKNVLPLAMIFGIDDKSKDATVEIFERYGAIVPFRFKRQGYGKSLVEGLTKAYYEYGCNCVIEMDADHPTSPLPKFIETIQSDKFDIVIGIESTKRSSRSVAMFLVKRFLGLKKFKHPTCGYIAFNTFALKEIFETKPRIKCNNDFVHIEILYKVYRRHLRFGELEFNGEEHEKHKMSMKRVYKWLWSFSILFIKRVTWHIWIDLKDKIFRSR